MCRRKMLYGVPQEVIKNIEVGHKGEKSEETYFSLSKVVGHPAGVAVGVADDEQGSPLPRHFAPPGGARRRDGGMIGVRLISFLSAVSFC